MLLARIVEKVHYTQSCRGWFSVRFYFSRGPTSSGSADDFTLAMFILFTSLSSALCVWMCECVMCSAGAYTKQAHTFFSTCNYKATIHLHNILNYQEAVLLFSISMGSNYSLRSQLWNSEKNFKNREKSSLFFLGFISRIFLGLAATVTVVKWTLHESVQNGQRRE